MAEWPTPPGDARHNPAGYPASRNESQRFPSRGLALGKTAASLLAPYQCPPEGSSYRPFFPPGTTRTANKLVLAPNLVFPSAIHIDKPQRDRTFAAVASAL
ncbi:hypothetical protein NMY22_g1601 [Coprinellus aureogranulatus]|nr:hypothetical protein NMY22_g1601 [Coprinellus aureogranulatus]